MELMSPPRTPLLLLRAVCQPELIEDMEGDLCELFARRIRKVLGASSMGLASLVAREFVILVGIAMVLATPMAWVGLDGWLQDFAYHVDVTWWTFALAGGLALVIALATISYQSLQAAHQDPVISLRSDS